MRYVSLFSGIEAATVAWHRLGWEPVAFAEIEKFPSAVLAHHYPEVPNLGDVTKVDWHEFSRANGPIDLVVFGSPCQSFSVAGKRLGLDDPRGNLALHALGIVNILRPQWFVFENVPGLLSSGGGRDFGAFLGTVSECGYGWAYAVLDAQYCRTSDHPRAVPQRRRRVFVVGYLGDWRRAAAVLFERESLSGHPPPGRKAGKGASVSVAPSLVSSGRGVERTGETRGQDPVVACDGRLIAADIVGQAMSSKWSKGSSGPAGDEVQNLVATAFKPSHFTRGKDGAPTDISPPLSADADKGDQDTVIAIQGAATRENPDSGPDGIGVRQDGAAYTIEARQEVQAVCFDCKGTQVQHDQSGSSPTLRAMGHDGSHANAGGQLAVAFDTTQITSPGNYSAPKPGDPCHPLASIAHVPAVAFQTQGGDMGVFDDVMGTLRGNSDRASGSAPMLAAQYAVRRLTPEECEKLQGFELGYTAVPYRGKPAADGPRYKALGNSMAVNCMRWLGDRIESVHAMQKALAA